jgi:hypothetical protein
VFPKGNRGYSPALSPLSQLPKSKLSKILWRVDSSYKNKDVFGELQT